MNKMILVAGRAGMDLYPEPDGTKTFQAQKFSAFLGGSAANIAAGISRLGGRSGLLTAISDDPVGQFVTSQLLEFGIDASLVTIAPPGARTTLALSETRVDDHETVIYRNDAADFKLDPAAVERIDFRRIAALVVTGTALAAEPSRAVIMSLLEHAKAEGVEAVLDLDYRPYSWASTADASTTLLSAAKQCNTVVGNDEEFAVLWEESEGSPELAARCLTGRTDVVVYKMGREGSITFHADREVRTGIFPVEALKPVGSGDAFLSAFLVARARGRSMEVCLRDGSASAALVVSRKGCAAAMPTEEELEMFKTEVQQIPFAEGQLCH